MEGNHLPAVHLLYGYRIFFYLLGMLTRRFFFLPLIPLALLLTACGGGEATSADPDRNAPRQAPPNIIFILADDLGYGDLGSYGQEKLETPHLDALAAGGMRFTQHYAGSTVCAPSRSALMSGLHTGHTFVRGNKEVKPEGQYPIADSVYTLAESLASAGYVTGAFGKWGLGFPGSEGDPLAQGFDRFFGYNCQRLAHNYYPGHLWDDDERMLLGDNDNAGTGTYAPQLIQEQTLDFLEKNADTSFFLYVPAIIPHAELIVPDSTLERFVGRLEEGEPFKGAEPGERGYRTGRYTSQEHPHAAFAAMIDVLDRQVGEIVNKVEELGIAENTLIVFTSDNGPHLEGGADPDFFDSNGPLRGYKRDLYEGGIRVPMIAYWPGTVAAGSESEHVSAFWDFFPTFAELTGSPRPPETDGISMLPTLTGKGTQEKHDYLYWEFHEKGGRQAVRRGKWKGVRYDVNKSGTDRPIELYDLSVDPGETTDLATTHPEVAAELSELMQTARTPSAIFAFSQDAYSGK
jgi:arylsulfatase A-like enzyme